MRAYLTPIVFLWVFFAFGQPDLLSFEPMVVVPKGLERLSATTAYSLTNDTSGRLLIATSNGLWCYNGNTLNQIPNRQSIRQPHLGYVERTESGTVLAISFDGAIYQATTDSLKYLSKFNLGSGYITSAICLADTLYVNHHNQLLKSVPPYTNHVAIFSNNLTNNYYLLSIAKRGKSGTVCYSFDRPVGPDSLFFLDLFTLKPIHPPIAFNEPIDVRIGYHNDTLYMVNRFPQAEIKVLGMAGNKTFIPTNKLSEQRMILIIQNKPLFAIATTNGLFNFKGEQLVPKLYVTNSAATDNYAFLSTVGKGVRKLNLTRKILGQQYTFTCIDKTNNGFAAGTTDGKIILFDSLGNFNRMVITHTNKEIEYLNPSGDGRYVLSSEGVIDRVDNRFYQSQTGKYAAFHNGQFFVSNQAGTFVRNNATTPIFNDVSGTQMFADRLKQLLVYKHQPFFVFNDSVVNTQNSWLMPYASLAICSDSLFLGNQDGLFVHYNNNWNKISNIPIRKLKSDGHYLLFSDYWGKLHQRVNGKIQFITKLESEQSDFLYQNGKLYLSGVEGLLMGNISDFTQQPTVNILAQFKIEQINANALGFYGLIGNIEFIDLSEQTPFIEYRILPADSVWRKLYDSPGVVRWASLWPRNYTIELKTADGSTQKYNISVPAPWWLNLYVMAMVLLLVFIIIYQLYLFFRRKKKKNEDLLKQITLNRLIALRSQMNPHFMFNVLNAIQGLVFSNKGVEAAAHLEKFAAFTRRLLEQSAEDWITLSDELNTLNQYLNLEKLRYGDELFIEINIESQLQQLNPKLPPMMIQPLVENALIHGLFHKYDEKKLSIQFSELNSDLMIAIVDNGIGRQAALNRAANRKGHKSFATNALTERLVLFSQLTGREYQLHYHDLFNKQNEPTGTKVVITLPLKY